MTDAPVQWVTAGGGLLSYRVSHQVYFAREENPKQIISSHSFHQDISQAVILGRYICLSQEGLGIRLLDLEDPAKPVDLGSLDLPVPAFHLTSWGNLLFVGSDGPGVRLFEIYPPGQPSSPSASQVVWIDRGSIPTETPATAITVSADGMAYIAAGNEVNVFDVSDPSNPIEIDHFYLNIPARSMSVNGNYLFVAAGAEGLHVIDLSVPGETAVLAVYEASSESLYVAGRKVFLATGANGLLMLEAGPASASTFDVQAVDYGFVPHTVNIHAGDIVRWTWVAHEHSTISETPCLLDVIEDSVTTMEGLPATRTFHTPGTFPFTLIPSRRDSRAGVVTVVTPLAAGDVVITPPKVDFGNITVGTPSEQMITITNQSVATLLRGTVGSLSGPFSVVSGGGAFNNVLPGQSVSVTVRFLPVATGLSTATLSITYALGLQKGSADVPLTGTGVTMGNISITPATVNFGSVAIGSSSDQTITVTNPSLSTKPVTGNVGSLSAPFSVVSGGGAFSLAPGQSKPVVVRFSPLAAGTVSQDLSITHNAGNQASPATISLRGTGSVMPPSINLLISPSSIDFGNGAVGQMFSQTLMITNQSGSTGTLTGNVEMPTLPFSVVSGGGAFSLAPDQSKSVVLRFAPTALGQFSGALSIAHNAGNQTGPINIPLSGTGVAVPPGTVNISIAPPSLDFGNAALGQAVVQSLTIINQSNSTAALTGSVGFLSTPFSVASGGGIFSLPPGQSKSVDVRFTPTTAGTVSQSLSIAHNAGNQSSPVNVLLRGTGISPIPAAITVTPTSINFGSVTIGQLSGQTFTIANQAGSTEPLIGNVQVVAAPFAVVLGGGSFSVSPGQSKSMTVRFLPTAAGTVSENLFITHNAANQSNPLSVSVSGTGVPAAINLSARPPAIDFGKITLGRVQDRILTITNQSTSTGTLTGHVGTLSPPFSVVSGGGYYGLTPGQSIAVTIRFRPVVEGEVSADLPITHNATNQNNPIDIPLSATGIAPAGPDIVLALLSGPSTGKPGGRISVLNRVTNQGTVQANHVSVYFYLSTDTQIDSSDLLLGERLIRMLAPGETSHTVSTWMILPRDVVPGLYFIGAMVTSNTGFDPKGITLCLPLSKLVLLSPRNRGKDISVTPTLYWSDVNGASVYEVQVATDSQFTDVITSVTGLTDTQWTVATALSRGTPYFWHVRAVNACGPGPWGSAWSFKTM